tara:strand:+ start:475 stop:621 length:147 start_codon:yes stop_codon:yes gene_type:complete
MLKACAIFVGALDKNRSTQGQALYTNKRHPYTEIEAPSTYNTEAPKSK